MVSELLVEFTVHESQEFFNLTVPHGVEFPASHQRLLIYPHFPAGGPTFLSSAADRSGSCTLRLIRLFPMHSTGSRAPD
jgi:hypothetical protein